MFGRSAQARRPHGDAAGSPHASGDADDWHHAARDGLRAKSSITSRAGRAAVVANALSACRDVGLACTTSPVGALAPEETRMTAPDLEHPALRRGRAARQTERLARA